MPALRDLDGAFRAAGAAAWGGVPFEALLPHMNEAARLAAAEQCPAPKTVLVAAFPYYAGEAEGNLSLYARGEDYHRVLRRRLTPVCDFLSEQYPGELFLPAADSSPLPEREAAWLAGLGLRGRHGLLILPPYGSYVFLATILTGAVLPLPATGPAPLCPNCGHCAAACPAGVPESGDYGRCLSELTQKKGTLTEAEEALLAAHPLIWGCDLCQRACPYNREARLTPLPEFRESLIPGLEPEDLEGLTNRTFQEKYGARAFAWRGPAVLRRNLSLREKNA